MDHAVDFAAEADEQAKFGNVLDLAFDLAADRRGRQEAVPRIVHALFEAQRDPPFDRIDVEYHDLDLLAGRNDLARMDVFLGPAHFGDVDQTFDARLQLHESAIIGDVGDPTVEFGADRIFQLDAFPRIGFQLFHAERDALSVGVEADHLNLNGLADLQGLARVIDPAPGDVGDVQQAVDAAQIDKRAVVGDVFDHPLQDLTFLEVGDQFRTRFGAGFFQHGAARNDDVAAAAIHFQDLERLRRAQQRRDVTHRSNIDLTAR